MSGFDTSKDPADSRHSDSGPASDDGAEAEGGGAATAYQIPSEILPFAARETIVANVDISTSPLSERGTAERYPRRGSIGAGGMGEVLLCHDEQIGRDVALKRMHAHSGKNLDVRARFEREARIQAQLEHPSIVPVYDMGIDPDGQSYFTMKRVYGVTLRDVIEALRGGDPKAERFFSRHKLLSSFSSVCLAVEYAHARGVIHRDLKPENVMLGAFGEVNVLDWGLAKVAGEHDEQRSSLAEVLSTASPREVEVPDVGSSPTAYGSILGTPGYMAPEQAAGDVDALGPASDIYALGAILFELLALEPLHAAESVTGRLHSTLVQVDGRPSARATDRAIPPELDDICQHAVALEPADRFVSARALHEAVDRFLQGDLDLERRAQMADEHAEAARSALEASRRGEQDAAAARTEAARELRSALALRPDHQDALTAMIELLVELPTTMPTEVEDALGRMRELHRPAMARAVAVTVLSIAVWTPFVLWMGIHSWRVFGAGVGVLVAAMLAIAVFGRKITSVSIGVVMVALFGVLAVAGLVAGPLILVPGGASVCAVLLIVDLRASARLRALFVAVCTGAIVLPLLLQTIGLLPSSYVFAGGQMIIVPMMLELPAGLTIWTLAAMSVATVVAPALLAGRFVDALKSLERKQFLRAWQLRQFVPDAAEQGIDQEQPAP